MSAGVVAGHHRRVAPLYAAVFAVAFLARLLIAVVRGGMTPIYRSYDGSVYYAAADALSFGRLPYRDFVLLHPPGLPLALTPFALLGRLTSDHVGFTAAVVAVMALGAVNAVLVALVCSRMGMPPAAAALGGAFYALWLGSAEAEYQIRLEPLGNFFLLLGLLAYLASRRSGSRAAALWAGVAFGVAASVKIWWAVPVILLVAWHLTRDHRRNLVPVTAGAAAALVVINAPFFAAAPRAMWDMVVAEQLGRPLAAVSPAGKAGALFGIGRLMGAPPTLIALVVLLGVVIAVTIIVAAWMLPSARLVVTLLVVQVGVLVAAPSWFYFYADYLAPAAAVTLAAGFAAARARHRAIAAAGARTAERVPPGEPQAGLAAPTASQAGLAAATVRHRWGMPAAVRWVPVLAILAVVAVTGRFLTTGAQKGPRAPGAELTAAAAGVHCLMSDAPSGLILLDALSRSLANGCPDWIDVTGLTYGIDKAVQPDGKPLPRTHNVAWQRDLLGYLTSGNAVYLVRIGETGLGKATLRELRSGGVLVRSGSDVIYRTPQHHGSPAIPDALLQPPVDATPRHVGTSAHIGTSAHVGTR